MLTYGAEATTAEDIVMAAQDDMERTTPLAMSRGATPLASAPRLTRPPTEVR